MTAAGRPLAWARVLRLSLFPSAMADPAVGALLGAHVLDWPRLVTACLASLSVYHGAMALNDWADRGVDAARGRRRPLPLGELSPRAVLMVACGLLAAGPLLARFGGLGQPAAATLAAAAAIAAAYDLFGRGARLGPTLLACARAANVLFGALALGWDPSEQLAPLLLASAYGMYVFQIGRLGRLEDGEDPAPLERRPSAYLRGLGVTLLVAPLLVALLARGQSSTAPSFFLAWAAAPLGIAILWTCARPLFASAATAQWTPAKVEAAMGPVLGGLVPFTIGALLLSVPGPSAWLVAALLLCAAHIGRRMMDLIPPS